MPRLHFCFVGSRPAITVLAWIAVLPFDLRGAPPVLLITIGRPGSSPPRSLPKRAFNAVPQQTASAEIPIASDAHPRHTSRGFLPWRFAYAGPRVRRATVMGPPSANLHTTGYARRWNSLGRDCAGLAPRPSSLQVISFRFGIRRTGGHDKKIRSSQKVAAP
jgi:hypothetical protein